MSANTNSSPHPAWINQFASLYTASVAHCFILYGDIRGFASYRKSHRALFERMLAERFYVVVSYSRNGFAFLNESMRKDAIALLDANRPKALPAPEGKFSAALGSVGASSSPPVDPFEAAGEPLAALSLLERLLTASWNESETFPSVLEREWPVEEDRQGGDRSEGPQEDQKVGKVALFIDFSDLLCPPVEKGVMSPNDRSILCKLLAWPYDKRLETMGNPIILVTRLLEDLHPDLRTASSGYKALEIALPDRGDRLEYLQNYEQGLRDAPEGEGAGETSLPLSLTLPEAANMTAGLSLRHIEDILLEAGRQPGGLSRELIKGCKARIIASEYTRLAEMIEPHPDGFDAVGGMSLLKRWAIEDVIAPLREQDIFDVPMGVLLVGPPGMGKTYFIRALVKEIGFNAVALRPANILGGIMGESEKNLQRFFALVSSLSPVLVFFDEVDQSDMGRRGTGSGNPVAANLFNQMLVFMSDETLRGRVIVFFATNRPDLLDPALLRSRRMDAIVPVLLPTQDERLDIVRKQALLQQVLLEDEVAHAIAEATKRYSGADLTAVISEARTCTKRAGRREQGLVRVLMPDALAALNNISPDLSRVDEYENRALIACNNKRFLPEEYAARLDNRERLQQETEQSGELGEVRSQRRW
jgi:transitional endoplasmic reticulum ATPase